VNPDPVGDLDQTNGHPALDIAGTQAFVDGDQPWVRTTCSAMWPPPDDLYSWYCTATLYDGTVPVASCTEQRHAGTKSELVTGIDKSKVTFAIEAEGFRCKFAEPIAHTSYGVECGTVIAQGKPRVTDETGTVPATKQQSSFGN
jgi:hypothetical protein